MNKINKRIEELRQELRKKGADAIIIPSNDPHQSEYVSDHWKIREYFSGFTGSAGTLVITEKIAALWTDSRYFLQVEEECASSEVELYRQSIPHAPEHVPWLVDLLIESATIAIDFRLFSLSQFDHLAQFAKTKAIDLVDFGNGVDTIWKDRPGLPGGEIHDFSIEMAGESRISKLQTLSNQLKDEKADYNLITRLDEIAWLFNIRGADVDFTPLVVAYAIVGVNKSFLFVDPKRVGKDLLESFEEAAVSILDYKDFISLLAELTENKKVICDKGSLNYACLKAIDGDLIYKESLIRILKARKNEVELKNARKAMVQDGVALTQFFYWLENYLKENSVNEYELGIKLESFRKKQPHYQGESFAAIVGYKGNGAIIHYTAPKEGSAVIKNEGILLIDSGAQYLMGTTDITRTIWLGGQPEPKIKQAYTAVLKGHIELQTMQFPEGTVGMQLDAYARMHLWRLGLNFPHGTGHGIGSYGMVHEPAQGFAASMTTARGSTAHEINQLTSIEPGCYQKNEFGIRIENVVVTVEKMNSDFGRFLGFEPITLCPIDTTLIDFDLFLPHEIDWLNAYHQRVYEELSPFIDGIEKEWLREKCEPITSPTTV